jgi:serine/threonine protein kinase/predicted ATPase
MGLDRLRIVLQLFDEVVDLPPAERHERLAGVAGDVRAEVLDMLDADADADDLSAVSNQVADMVAGGAVEAALAPDLGLPYRMLRLLGSGGMGEVWLAEDASGEQVALKLVHAHQAPTAHLARRFAREARAGLAVDHPNVVRTRASLTARLAQGTELPVIVLEYVPGRALSSVLHARGALDVDTAVRLASDTARGLAAIHSAGFVHRDIKPGNLQVGDDGSLRILDLGIARPLEAGQALTQTGQILGTLTYAAPEQLLLSSARIDPRADLYALGLVLRRMLGEPAPKEDLPLGALLQRKQQRLPRLEGVPDWLADLVAALTEPDRELRPPTAGAVLEHLTAREAPSRTPSDDTFLDTVLLGNLPEPVSRCVGRADALDAMEAHFADRGAVVTLVGPAGVGKSHLALHFADRSGHRWPGGAWYCDLTDAASELDLARALGAVLDIPLDGGDPVATLGDALAARGPALLVLDTVDRASRSLSAVLQQWRRRAPELSWLLTSRVPTGVRDEARVAIAPLAVPALGAPLSDVLDASATQLFVALASDAKPGFTLDDDNAADVASLVRALDGLPLALELAAARVRVLSPRRLLQRLGRRFDLLQHKTAGRTLRGALDMSWELLAPWEQHALATCSVFAGSFDLEAVEAVVDLGDWPEAPWPMDVVEQLQERSLLHGTDIDGDPRFALLATVRDYAAEHLVGDTLADARRRHAEHYATWGERRNREALDGIRGRAMRARLRADLDNVAVAARNAAALGLPDTSARAALAALALLIDTGPLPLADQIGTAALDAAPSEDLAIALRLAVGAVRNRMGRADLGEPLLEDAAREAADLGNASLQAQALCALGHGSLLQGRLVDARDLLERSVALYETGRNDPGLATALTELAHVVGIRGGDTTRAVTLLERAQRLYVARGDASGEALADSYLGALRANRGEFDGALQAYGRAAALGRRVGDRRTEGLAEGMYGAVLMVTGQLEAARPHLERALALQRDIGDVVHEAMHVRNFAELLGRLDELEAAIGWLERGLELARALADPITEGNILTQIALYQARLGHPDAAAHRIELAERCLTDDPTELGKCQCTAGQIALLRGDTEEAARRLAAAAALADPLGLTEDAELTVGIAALRDALG